MSGIDSELEEKGDVDLLQQLELILDHDPLIDEVGFIHPSLFAALNEGSDEIINKTAEAFSVLQYDKTVFWNSNHKLAISIQVLPQLYKAALNAYMEARRSYKWVIESSLNKDSTDNAAAGADYGCNLESVRRHTRALLILSYDFKSAWNLRKLVLSKKHDLSMVMDDLRLSALILSYAPKSESAWSHRRWLIKMIAEEGHDLQTILGNDSTLVKNIAEKSKMNYRAWNHRCWLVFYMTKSQVLDELKTSRTWAELHVADNCCFHYHRRLLLKTLGVSVAKQGGETSLNHTSHVYGVWKEELQWNKRLIQQYIGREALWIHRRFLSHCWIKHLATSLTLDDFLAEELELLQECLNFSSDGFDDRQSQAQHAAAYILWISKQVPECRLNERLKEAGDIKGLLTKNCPEKMLLWERLLD